MPSFNQYIPLTQTPLSTKSRLAKRAEKKLKTDLCINLETNAQVRKNKFSILVQWSFLCFFLFIQSFGYRNIEFRNKYPDCSQSNNKSDYCRNSL